MKQGWEVNKLGNVCIMIKRGVAPKYVENGGLAVINQKCIRNHKIDLSLARQHNNDIKPVNPERKIKLGDVLVNSTGVGTLGRVAQVRSIDQEGVTVDTHVTIVRPVQELFHLDYFGYVLISIEDEIQQSGAGASGQTELSRAVLEEDFNVSYPISLDEQKRIVAKLDECFESIDKARANVEKNLQNAKDLFQSQLNQIFSQKGDGWVENNLKDITTKIGSGATPRGGQASYKESGISLIRSLNVHDEAFKLAKLAFIDEEQAGKLDNVKVQEGDVLLNITGASVARCCIAPKEYLPARVNQHVSIIRLIPGHLNTDFLHYCMISRANKDRLLGIGEQGATRQAITKAQIESFSISYPKHIGDQDTLVEKLNDIKIHSLKLQASYQQELDALDELKKSILQKAFNGEL